MHVVTSENFGEATDAVRDILMMYVGLADDTEGFGHAADVYVRFDPLKYVDAIDDGRGHYVDLDLLRSGSAVAVVCAIYDQWCEEQLPLAKHGYFERVKVAIMDGRFRAFPDIEAFVFEAFRQAETPLDDPWFEQAVLPIYRKYVLGLFQRLATLDRANHRT